MILVAVYRSMVYIKPSNNKVFGPFWIIEYRRTMIKTCSMTQLFETLVISCKLNWLKNLVFGHLISFGLSCGLGSPEIIMNHAILNTKNIARIVKSLFISWQQQDTCIIVVIIQLSAISDRCALQKWGHQNALIQPLKSLVKSKMSCPLTLSNKFIIFIITIIAKTNVFSGFMICNILASRNFNIAVIWHCSILTYCFMIEVLWPQFLTGGILI